MFGLGTTELILILVIVVIIFGVGKLPELGTGFGKAIKNFKKSSNESEIDVTPDKDGSEKLGSHSNKTSHKKG
ncbi:MAG: twin-arginine translocase TatA/TatE family subunit [Deltaproteobacteria bacterium]|nr:twin-arginine translocase TatA/TatE family subunit [Deltaproteobacteria bacterium]